MLHINYTRRYVFNYFVGLVRNPARLERAVADGELGVTAKAAYSLQPDDYSRRRFLAAVGGAVGVLLSAYCSGSKGSIDPCSTLIPGTPTPSGCEEPPQPSKGNTAKGPPLVDLLDDKVTYKSGKVTLGGKPGDLTEEGWEVKEIPTTGIFNGDFTGSGFASSRFGYAVKQGMNQYGASRVLPKKINGRDFDAEVFRLIMCQNQSIYNDGDQVGTASWDKNRMPDVEVYLDTFKVGILSEDFYRRNFRMPIINSSRITLAPLIMGSELPNYEIQERRGPVPQLPQEGKVIVVGGTKQDIGVVGGTKQDIDGGGVAANHEYTNSMNRVYCAKITLTSEAGSGSINHEFANIAALSDFRLPFPPSAVNKENIHWIGISDYDKMYWLARDLLPRKTHVTNGFIDVSHLGLEAVVSQIIREAGEIHGVQEPEIQPQNYENQENSRIKHKPSDEYPDDEGFESNKDFIRHQEWTRELMRQRQQ